MDYQAIQVDVTEKIGTITLNRPEKRNALSILVRKEITDCLEQWEGDESVGVVIITGAGPVFSAGFDLKEFSKPELAKEVFKSSAVYHRVVWNYGKPTIAAVNGHAFGGGFDLATLCDVRICNTGAVFGHPEIKFGAPPLYTPLRWIVGSGMARDLCLTGRHIPPHRTGQRSYRRRRPARAGSVPRQDHSGSALAHAPDHQEVHGRRRRQGFRGVFCGGTRRPVRELRQERLSVRTVPGTFFTPGSRRERTRSRPRSRCTP